MPSKEFQQSLTSVLSEFIGKKLEVMQLVMSLSHAWSLATALYLQDSWINSAAYHCHNNIS